MPLSVIFVLHGLFVMIVLLRWAVSWRARAVQERGARPASEGPARVGVAPHAIADLALQVGAFALLYLASGLTLVALRPDPWLVRTPLVPAQRVVATMVMVLGDGLLAWTLIVFGSWRLLARIEPTHRLVTTGPFGLVRHPNYLALILLALGTFLWIPTPWVLVAFVGVVLTSERRARAEERLLEETFGERYRAYLGRVRRWLPGLY